jgi:hypothetical protein
MGIVSHRILGQCLFKTHKHWICSFRYLRYQQEMRRTFLGFLLQYVPVLAENLAEFCATNVWHDYQCSGSKTVMDPDPNLQRVLYPIRIRILQIYSSSMSLTSNNLSWQIFMTCIKIKTGSESGRGPKTLRSGSYEQFQILMDPDTKQCWVVTSYLYFSLTRIGLVSSGIFAIVSEVFFFLRFFWAFFHRRLAPNG